MHTSYLLKRYLVVCVLTMVGLMALGAALIFFADLELGGALGIMTAILPAMDAGQAYAKRTEQMPDKGYAWKLSAMFVSLNFIAGCLLLAVLLAVIGGGGAMTALVSGSGVAILVAIIAVVFVIYWLASRFFFGFGAKTQLKHMAERAARAAEKANEP